MTLSTTVMVSLLFGALAWAVAFALYPHLVDYGDDGGDGKAVIRLPKPAKAESYRKRTVAFFLVGTALSILVNGLHQFQPIKWYQRVVSDIAISITARPSEVLGYTKGLSTRGAFLWVVAMISLACVLRVTPGRRLALFFHAGLYISMAAIVQAGFIAISIDNHIPVEPSNIAAIVFNIILGTIVSMRVVLTTFALPRSNTLPKTRPVRVADVVIMIMYVGVAVALPLGLLAVAAEPSLSHSELHRVLPMFALTLFSSANGVGLLVVRTARGADPAPLRNPPPIDVITPAWNEAAGIRMTLESVDRAALEYGGKVRVIVSNDGSSDDTVALAVETMKSFQAAEGVVLDHPNTGKGGALNRALAHCEADIVVRVDGDCIMHSKALKYSAPWFQNPAVGIVGSLMLPREDCTSWYARMRAIECLLGFGCTRMGQQVVDGVGVVPGTFTAFRREPMMRTGGFADGMNGEDSDQTCQFGRMGYEVVIDPRVICYEDVPPTLAEFVEQRTRWSRANMHVFARHNPLRNGLAGPRTWFYMWRRGMQWALVPLMLLTPLYIVFSLGGLTTRLSAVSILALPLLLASFWFVVLLAAAARYRWWKGVAWFPTFIAFSYIRRVALLEAFLSLPTRPVINRTGPHKPIPEPEPDPVPTVIQVAPERLSWKVA